jgi:outer membrane autotransporter protein
MHRITNTAARFTWNTALLALFAATPWAAHAQSTTPLNERAGAYVGASVGASTATLRSIGRTESGDVEAGTGAKLRAGYWFGPHWGVEASAARLGRIEQRFDSGVWRAKGDAFQISGLGRVALARDWSLIGKLGVYRAQLRDDGSTGDRAGFDQLNGRSTGVVVGGLGLEYSLTDQAALTLELDGLGQAGKKAAPAYIGAGVRWAF